MSNLFTSDGIMNQSDSNKESDNDKEINKTIKRKKTRNKFGYFINEDENDENKLSFSDNEESDNYYGQFTPGKDKYVINNLEKEKNKNNNNNKDEFHNENILISTERNNIQINKMNIKSMEKY